MMKGVVAVLSAILLLGFAKLASAASKTISGTLEDSFCYVTMGAHGPSHKQCAQACARKGIPVSLIQDGTGTSYILLPPKNDEPIPDSITNRMENKVTVTGNEFVKGGVHYLTVESVK